MDIIVAVGYDAMVKDDVIGISLFTFFLFKAVEEHLPCEDGCHLGCCTM
jgi:hypothetical protein